MVSTCRRARAPARVERRGEHAVSPWSYRCFCQLAPSSLENWTARRKRPDQSRAFKRMRPSPSCEIVLSFVCFAATPPMCHVAPWSSE